MRKAATSETWEKPTLAHPISVYMRLISGSMVVWFVVDAGYRVTEAPKGDESGSQPVAETVTETEKHVEELPSNDADAAMNVCFEHRPRNQPSIICKDPAPVMVMWKFQLTKEL